MLDYGMSLKDRLKIVKDTDFDVGHVGHSVHFKRGPRKSNKNILIIFR